MAWMLAMLPNEGSSPLKNEDKDLTTPAVKHQAKLDYGIVAGQDIALGWNAWYCAVDGEKTTLTHSVDPNSREGDPLEVSHIHQSSLMPFFGGQPI